MKLSQLIAYRNELKKLNAITVLERVKQDLAVIEHVAGTGTHTQAFSIHNQSIQSAFEDYQRTLDDLKAQVQDQINQEEKHWFQESYRLYSEEMVNESTEYILDRRMTLRPETRDFLQARIRGYTDWRVPGMIIRPGRENWIQDLVSLDPMYILDQNLELLEPALSVFHEAYQRRLRKYLINERSNDPILRRVPDQQIGFCLVYNFFNFRPIEIIKSYLQELFSKLRPGGILIMTINDCDNEKAVMLAEQYYCCYTPGSLICNLATAIGYDIEFSHSIDGASTWLELRKPGHLRTVRGGQVLARVLPIL